MEEFSSQIWGQMYNNVKPAGVATLPSDRLERFTAWCLKEESLIIGIKALQPFEALSPFAQSMGALLWDLHMIDPKQVLHPMAHGEGFAIYRIEFQALCNIPGVQALGEAMERESILSTHLPVPQKDATHVVFHPKVVC